jgi:hypothetical protein
MNHSAAFIMNQTVKRSRLFERRIEYLLSEQVSIVQRMLRVSLSADTSVLATSSIIIWLHYCKNESATIYDHQQLAKSRFHTQNFEYKLNSNKRRQSTLANQSPRGIVIPNGNGKKLLY